MSGLMVIQEPLLGGFSALLVAPSDS